MATYLWGPEKSLIVPTPDLAFLMREDDSAWCQMHQVGIPEKTLINWARQFGGRNKTFIDCGAHMGSYSVMLASEFKEVYAFEAQLRSYYQLCGNLFLNEINNVKPHHVAITDKSRANQTVTLSIVSADGGGSTLLAPHEPVLAKEEVQARDLDSFDIQNVGLIKLDIEGSELDAIKGASQTLERNGFPPIIFESNVGENPSEQAKKLREDLFSYLYNLKYQIAEIRPYHNMFLASQQPQ